jgi:manganese efflux pump family protein
MGIATLISWLLTASIGARMLASLIAGGGLRRAPGGGKDRFPPVLLVCHFGLALTGLAVWVAYLAAGSGWLAWAAVFLLMPAVGLGISTVTLWTPYPGPHGAPAASPAAQRALISQVPGEALTGQVIDDLIDRLLTGPPPATPARGWRLKALIPVGHGIGATATFLLAVLTAATR